MKDVLITPDGIKKNLKNFKPLDAVCEYIWNGFDAEASVIKINMYDNEYGILKMIEIDDNGTGICYEELSNKFQKFNDSSKYHGDQSITLPHGKRGIGRLTFFSFAYYCRWETVYKKTDGNYSYYISMDRDNLNKYDDNNGKAPVTTNKETGTLVRITQLDPIDKEELIIRLKEEFFWFLELNHQNGFKIFIDDKELKYNDYVIKKVLIDISELKLQHQYEITFVHWSEKLGSEYSRYYYIGSDGKERYKETTKLNKHSDQFYHSVFIKSSYFDDFHWVKNVMEGQEDLFPNKGEEEYKKLMEYIKNYLIDYRRKYLKETSDKYIADLVENKVFPEFDDSNIIQHFQHQELNNLVGAIYTAQPNIFSGLSDTNKKILIGTLNLILESGNKLELYKILEQVIELDEESMKELSEILEYTSLNHVTRTIKLLSDRQKVIGNLKELVFSKDVKTYEYHIQNVVEEHYWIFGEQYNLVTAEEPDFESALRGLIKIQQEKDKKVTLEHKDKNKEMDIFAVRKDITGKITDNIVVELKNPNINLGEDEVSQIKRYARVIKSDPRFNASNVKWTFYLIGNQYDKSKYIENEITSHRANGQPFLIHTQDDGLTNIYVIRWSELFDDLDRRYDYLMKQLQLKQNMLVEKHDSADEIVESLKGNTAKAPDAVIPKRKG